MHALERRDAAMLALLALEGPQARQRLAQELWPDAPVEAALNNLRQRLFRLKRVAGSPLVDGRTTLSLAQGWQHDVQVPGADASLLLGALDYEDCGELAERVDGLRRRWSLRRQQARAAEADQLEAQGRLDDALALAEGLAAEPGADEDAYRRLIRLHYLRGERTAALAAYERCCSVLAARFDASPSPETQALHDLLLASTPPVVQAAPRCALTRPPRLVGRSAAWQALCDALAQRRALLVVGEAGMGKSRLLSDFAAEHECAAPLAAHRGDGAAPYGLLARLASRLAECHGLPATAWAAAELARMSPAFGTAPADAFSALRLRQAFAEALRGWRSAGLRAVVLDDLHLSDVPSLKLLAGCAAEEGLAWLLASRPMLPWPADVSTPTAGAGSTESPMDEPVPWSRLTLLPWDSTHIAELVDSLGQPGWAGARWAPALAQRTGGNPLFVLQCLSALLESGGGHAPADATTELPLPPDALVLIESRIAALPASARRLLRLMAVADAGFQPELVPQVLGGHLLDHADGWQLLERAHLVADGRLAHDLIREAAVRSIPAEIARALHRQVATVGAGLQHPPQRLALHWAAAQEWALAASAHESVAAAARERSAPEEERSALAEAARCHAAAGNPAAAFRCDWRRVHVMLGAGGAGGALVLANELLQAAEGPHERAAALEARAHVLCERYEAEDALAAAREAQRLSQSGVDPRLKLLAAQRAAGALMRLGRAAEAAAELQADDDQLAALPSDERLHWLSDCASALDHAQRGIEAASAFQRVIDESERQGRWTQASEACCNLAVAEIYRGRLLPAYAASERGLANARRAGMEGDALLIDNFNRLGTMRDLGRYAEWLAEAELLPAQLRGAGYDIWALAAENDLAVGYALLGRPELAARCLTPLPADAVPMMRAPRLFTEARLVRDFGVPLTGVEPAAWVERASATIEAQAASRAAVRLRIALERARDMDIGEALDCSAAVEAEADALGVGAVAGQAAMLQLQLLLKAGRGSQGQLVAQRLLDRVATNGPMTSVYAPEVGWLAWQVLARSQPARATAALAQAHAWIEERLRQDVPAPFRQSFLQRNAFNASVLRAAAGQLQPPG